MELCESAPDIFIRYKYPGLLDESRKAVAKVLNAPVDTIVYASNATTGVNAILRNFAFNENGKDEVFHFSTIYGGVSKFPQQPHPEFAMKRVSIASLIRESYISQAFDGWHRLLQQQ